MGAFGTCGPAGRDFGLIEAPLAAVRDDYLRWWRDLGQPVTALVCDAPLADRFAPLEPLSGAMNRVLLLETVAGWTAFFRNGLQGSDPASAMPVLSERLGMRAMRVCHDGPDAT